MKIPRCTIYNFNVTNKKSIKKKKTVATHLQADVWYFVVIEIDN